MEHWTDDMSARSRVEAVATTLTQPRSINWISEQAGTGWETAKKQIDLLVDRGVLQAVNDGGDTRYEPDPVRDYLDHVAALVTDHSRDELRDELQAIATEIEAWQRTYDVDSIEELEASLGAEDLSAEEIGDRRRVLRYWEENAEYRRLVTNALTLYDDLTNRTEQDPPRRPPSERLTG